MFVSNKEDLGECVVLPLEDYYMDCLKHKKIPVLKLLKLTKYLKVPDENIDLDLIENILYLKGVDLDYYLDGQDPESVRIYFNKDAYERWLTE